MAQPLSDDLGRLLGAAGVLERRRRVSRTRLRGTESLKLKDGRRKTQDGRRRKKRKVLFFFLLPSSVFQASKSKSHSHVYLPRTQHALRLTEVWRGQREDVARVIRVVRQVLHVHVQRQPEAAGALRGPCRRRQRPAFRA